MSFVGAVPSMNASELDSRQAEVFRCYREGRRVAILGSAGSGKSFAMSCILQDARRRHGPFPIVVACAKTNAAAVQMDGVTIHSLLHVYGNWEKWDGEKLWSRIGSYSAVQCLRSTEIVVIDEVGTIEELMFDALDFVFSQLAASSEDSVLPFGGRQVIVAGDPYQLEPVRSNPRDEGSLSAFVSTNWSLIFGGLGSGVIAILEGNHRQASDPAFHAILQRVKQGNPSLEDIRILNNTSRQEQRPPRHYTEIFLRKDRVNEINRYALGQIPGEVIVSLASDKVYSGDRGAAQAQLDDAVDYAIKMKRGCVVLLLRKTNGMLPGTLLVVVDSTKTRRGTRSNTLSQYSITARECGPNGRTVVIEPVLFKVHSSDMSLRAVRTQLPLTSGYSVTVHRTQGLTLEHVAMDFDQVGGWFLPGMVYVILSRCPSLKGLWIRNLRPQYIVVPRHVDQLMKKVRILKGFRPSRVIGLMIDPDSRGRCERETVSTEVSSFVVRDLR